MQFPQLTKLDLAKLVVSQLIAVKIQSVTKNAIADRTDIDPDGIILEVGTGVAGQVAALAISPQTDQLVDYTAEKLTKLYNDRKTAPEVVA